MVANTCLIPVKFIIYYPWIPFIQPRGKKITIILLLNLILLFERVFRGYFWDFEYCFWNVLYKTLDLETYFKSLSYVILFYSKYFYKKVDLRTFV